MYLKACLNGATTRERSAAVPLTPAELAAEAASAVAAGADALHVHPRDAEGNQSMAAADVGAAVEAIRAAVPGVPVGITTGAWIEGDPARRLALVAEWTVLPDFASVNFSEGGAEDLARELLDRGVGVEAGLWSGEDARRLVASGLAERCVRLLLEPVRRELDEALALVGQIEAILDGAGVAAPRLLHGGRATAWPLLEAAARRGYQSRIGLEDTVELPDGTPADGNGALVVAARRIVEAIEAGAAR